jgi:bacillithiol synthase
MTAIPLDRAPGIPALARGLATGTPDVSAFLPRAANVAAVAAQASAARSAFRPRTLAAGADPRLAKLARGAVAGVFTGQQAGLFGGPHLTLAKAIAAEKLAADLSASATSASAAFWCASEDHDLVEVTRVVLPMPDGPRDAGPDPAPLLANRAPVGALPIGGAAEAILRAAVDGLGTAADEEAVAALSGAHAGRTYVEAFTQTLAWLLGDGLPIIDAADGRDKRALVPLAVRLVKERRQVRELLDARDGALEAAGHPLQVKRDASAVPLFVRAGHERLLLFEDAGHLKLKGREERYTEADAVSRLESGEWLPSFSALTRPLAASVLYPVGATILGPAEVAYWAQAWPLFGWAEIVPPAVLLRPLVALETPSTRRRLEKLGVTLADVLEGEEALLRKKGSGSAQALLGRVSGIRDRAVRELDATRPELRAVDPSLDRAVAATRDKLTFAFEKLIEKTEGAAGRADALVARQIRSLVTELLPDGQLAERVYPVLPYVLRVGREAVVGALRRDLRWDEPGLQEIVL